MHCAVRHLALTWLSERYSSRPFSAVAIPEGKDNAGDTVTVDKIAVIAFHVRNKLFPLSR